MPGVVRVRATDSASFVRPAPRPLYSVLGQDKWQSVGLTRMRDWRVAYAAARNDGLTR